MKKTNILIGRGFVDHDFLDKIVRRKSYIVVTDEHIHQLYPSLFEGFHLIIVPAGEKAKQWDVYQYAVTQAIDYGLDRGGVVVAVGGGCVTDLAGFVAATIKRGVRLMNVPTSLIGMIDASIGGKNGINLPQGKNLLGTFWKPINALIDLNFLETLPAEFFNDSLGELVKYGVGFDADLIQEMSQEFTLKDEMTESFSIPDMTEWVKRCVHIKNELCELDFHDQEERRRLNLGHTLAHAIENTSDYKYTHGSAVAIGVYYMAQLAYREEKLTRSEMARIQRLYDSLSLPKEVDAAFDFERAMTYVAQDKKMKNQQLHWVKIDRLGHCAVVDTPMEEVVISYRSLHQSPVEDLNQPVHVVVPPSKSYAHRALMLAALADGRSIIKNLDQSEDVQATMDCLSALGVAYQWVGPGVLSVEGGLHPEEKVTLPCRESGTTARLMMPFFHYIDGTMVVEGKGSLLQRTMKPYYELFAAQQVICESEGDTLPVSLSGRLIPGHYRMVGNISSQFISGLLMVLPTLSGDSVLEVEGAFESEPYVQMTISTMRAFGVEVLRSKNNKFVITGKQQYKCCEYEVEGDYSNAAFWLVAKELGRIRAKYESIEIKGLPEQTVQGDKAVQKIIFRRNDELALRVVDLSQNPDLLPILAVYFALIDGKTRITGIERTRMKESDRIQAIVQALVSTGATIRQIGDDLEITGVYKLSGGHVKTYGDHRIAMAMSIASLFSKDPVTLDDPDCVAKSYPNFFEDLAVFQQQSE